MAKISRYLLVTDYDGHWIKGDRELDVVSWDNLAKIGNAADYDAWILNVGALTRCESPKVFSLEEFNVLFGGRAMLDVIRGGGDVFFIGDFKESFFLPPNKGGGADGLGKPKAVVTRQSIDPLAKVISIERDSRPVEYGRTNHPYDWDNYNKSIYSYLDKVSSFDYSLKVKTEDLPEESQLATTNFGTCLALRIQYRRGNLVLLPSLGMTVEEEDRYILKHFFDISLQASPPAWANELAVSRQKTMETEVSQKQQSLEALFSDIKAQKKELVHLQRWKRLLYDDGTGLEEIVKESFELLGAKVVKKTPEKDDYRLEVAGHGPCVLEVKSTRKDQFLRRDLRQLSEWIGQMKSEELVAVKGAFVGNASREKAPSSRGSMFDSNNAKYAELEKMVLMCSMDLYCVVLLALLGTLNVDEFWQKFFACSGEFDAAAFWTAVPEEFGLRTSDENASTGIFR